jgi:hypothetical protein
MWQIGRRSGAAGRGDWGHKDARAWGLGARVCGYIDILAIFFLAFIVHSVTSFLLARWVIGYRFAHRFS